MGPIMTIAALDTVRCAARRAFTLVEILIVVVVLGILAAVVVPKFAGATDEALYGNAIAFGDSLDKAMAMYTSKTGKVPRDFASFISYDGRSSSTQSFFKVGQDTRGLLKDAGADIGFNSNNRIKLEYKNGLVAQYDLASGTITATYTGPAVP
jgi:prepilin-type N-terminal cleavage/methylation domain-containing protein